jgi:hypothetical protein
LESHKDFQETMDLQPLSDCMPLRYDFRVFFELVISEREDEDNVPSKQEAIGNNRNEQSGIGIYGPSVRHFEALGSMPIIFQAEMYAIIVWTRICLEHEGNDNRQLSKSECFHL